jgi:hypothetical protein
MMALKAATKLHKKGSWERLMEESRGYDRRKKRAEKWGAGVCPSTPMFGFEKDRGGTGWLRLPKAPANAPEHWGKVPWSELAMHTGHREAKILRVAFNASGHSAAVCTTKGYVDGLVGEVISYPEACLAGLRDINPRMCEGR